MNKSEIYFPLLAKMMSEDKVKNIAINKEIDETFNELYTLIDLDLMNDIEKIGYPNKYKNVDVLKGILKDYKLLMFFPELINKNVVSVFQSSNLARKILSNYNADYKDKIFGLGQKKIIENIATVYTNRESGWKCLTVPENLVDVLDQDYFLTQKLIKKGFSSESLISILSGSLNTINPNVAFVVLPEQIQNSKYGTSLMSYSDYIVLDEGSLEAFGQAMNNGLFKYISGVLLIDNGKLTKAKKKYTASLCKEISLEICGLGEVFEKITNLQYSRENFLLTELIEESINEVVNYCADKIALLMQRENNLKRDIVKNSDGTDAIQELKGKVLSQIEKEKTLYKAITKTRSEIIEKAHLLEETVKKSYLYNSEENDDSLSINHYPIQTIWQKLYLQYASFIRVDNSKKNKELVKQYGEQLKVLVPVFQEAISMCDSFYAKKIKNKEVIAFVTKESDIDFITRIQIMIAANMLSWNNDHQIFMSLARNIPSIFDEYVTDSEFYIAGLYFEYIQKDLKSAKRHYEISLMLGNNFAGDRIIAILQYENISFDLVEYANLLVPSACYEMGKQQVYNKEYQEQGVLYLKIAAAFGNLDALRYLADFTYNIFLDAVRKDEIYCDEFFENANASIMMFRTIDDIQGTDDNCIQLGFLYYYIEDYQSALDFLDRANSGDCYNLLGIMFEEGRGCAVDRKVALSYYMKSKDMGCNAGAANWDRLNTLIAEETKKNLATTGANYSSSSYYSSYYSGYSGYSSYSGCVIEGTEIMLSDGATLSIEKISAKTEVMNCKGTISVTSDELVKNNEVTMLYSVNNDIPFMSLEHAILTERGWCSLSPQDSMEINPFFEVKKLELGDVFYKKILKDGVMISEKCVVEKLNVKPNATAKMCYDLHFYDGHNSYYANGYPCLLNYPLFTLASIQNNIKKMTQEQIDRFISISKNNKDIFEIVFGKVNMGIFFNNMIEE